MIIRSLFIIISIMCIATPLQAMQKSLGKSINDYTLLDIVSKIQLARFKSRIYLSSNSLRLIEKRAILTGNLHSSKLVNSYKSGRRAEYYQTYGRNITLCIDQDGSELAGKADPASTCGILQTLKSNASVILASASLWANVVRLHNPDTSLLEAWDIYSYNKRVLLFIPKDLYAQAGKSNPKLGIDLTHFTPNHTLKDLETPTSKSFKQSDVLTAFNHLILNKTEDNLAQTLPWTLFIKGHGYNDGQTHHICGMPAYYFNEFLNYCNNYIALKGLIFTSCYGGSRNVLIDAFAHQQFNFPIIGSAFADSSVCSIPVSYNPNYEQFIILLHSINAFTCHTYALQNALFTIMCPEACNLFRIREAKSNQFVVLPQVNCISSKERTHDHVNTNNHNLLTIDTPMTLHSVKLNCKEIGITSTLSGQVKHYIDRLDIPSITQPKQLFNAFMCVQSKDKRIYTIKRFTGHNDLNLSNVIVFHCMPQSFGPRTAHNIQKNNFMYFEYEQNPYVASLTNDYQPFEDKSGKIQDVVVEKVSPEQAREYKRFFMTTKAYLWQHPHYTPEPAIFTDRLAISHPLKVSAINNALLLGKLSFVGLSTYITIRMFEALGSKG